MAQADQDTQGWTGRTVHGRDGTKLGTLTEVFARGEGGTTGDWGVVRSRLGRRRLVPLNGASTTGERTMTVPVDRRSLRAAPDTAAGAPDADTESTLQHHYTGHGVLTDAHARQHERFGGAKVGAAFFGWLVAVGLTVLLGGLAGGLAAAAGASAAFPAGADVAPMGLTGAVVAVVVLLIAYYAGGYVAGRLARFDGTRNGVLAWVIGLVVTVVAAIVAVVAGSRYDVLGTVRLPVVPVSADQLTLVGVVALVVVVLGTLLAAALGGKAGERFHHRVDRVATDTL
jgi:hypothetical protein